MNKLTKIAVLLALVTGSFPMFAAAKAVYLSPTGEDHNPGTKSRPIRTLQRARELVRAILQGANQKLSGDVTIYLSGGTYRLTQPLALDVEDSGTHGHDVRYTAMAGEKPVISGAVRVTGWKISDAKRNLWSAPVPSEIKDTRQLYVNGVRALRARGRAPVMLTQTATGYTADSAEMAGWRNLRDIEFVYTGGNSMWSEAEVGLGSWTEPRCPVASIEGTAITMAQPCWDNSTKRVMLPSGVRTANLVGPAKVGKQPSYVENAFELLGTPGQWYLDRGAGVFYYTPRSEEDMTKADVEVPVLERLIVGVGTSEKPIHNIVFSGLQFSYATWLSPSTPEGFSEIQANYRITGANGYAVQGLCALTPDGACPYGAWTKAPGNVSFDHGVEIQFVNDAFVHLGGVGLELGNGSQEDLVQGCVFTDISSHGLELGGVDLPMATGGDITRDNKILNNHVYNVAAEFHGGIGIDVGYAQRTLVQYNQIDHLSYTGVSMGWGGWPDKIQQAGQENFSQNNRVANNLIFDHMLMLADGAGIYTQGLTGSSLTEGEKLTGNVIYRQFGSGHALYTDNGCKNVSASGNVLFQTNHDNWGGRHRDYYNGQKGTAFDAFNFEDNYWQQGDVDSSREGVTLKNNHLIDALDQAPASTLKEAGLRPEYKNILGLQFGAPSAPEPPGRVGAAAGDGFAYVSWNPPAFEGSSPISLYTVSSPNGAKATISAAEFWEKGYIKLTGLTKDTAYTFTVTATNATGESAPSLPSRSVSTNSNSINPPSAPSNVKALAGVGRASIHFQDPGVNKGSDGGSPIVAYSVTVKPDNRKVMFSGRKVLTIHGGAHTIFGVVNGLEAGKTYTFDISAVSAAGEGVAATTNAVTIP